MLAQYSHHKLEIILFACSGGLPVAPKRREGGRPSHFFRNAQPKNNDVRPQRPRKEPEISACARGEFEACLEQERI